MKNSKEVISKIGILLIRAIWPEKGKGGVRKAAILLLVLSAVFEFAEASPLGEILFGQTEATSEIGSGAGRQNKAGYEETARTSAKPAKTR